DFSFERKDRLVLTIASLLGRAAGGITLDDVDFRKRRIALLTIGEFARQHVEPIAPFRTISRAFRAASRARAASSDLPTMRRATVGFCSRNSVRRSLRNDSTAPLTSELSLPFVCPSNCGCGSLTEITATRPSRTSSPVSDPLKFFARPDDCAYALIVRVNAERNPERCEPPSTVLMLFANE